MEIERVRKMLAEQLEHLHEAIVHCGSAKLLPQLVLAELELLAQLRAIGSADTEGRSEV